MGRETGSNEGGDRPVVRPAKLPGWGNFVAGPDLVERLQAIVTTAQSGRAEAKDGPILFSGPSGTGKTMAAELIARSLGRALHRIELGEIVGKYIGETEKNLRRVFQQAEMSGAILLFDEADALFGKRSEVKDAHDRYANVDTGLLLQRIEAFEGIAILATNRKANIDPAFIRRLRAVVEFPMPDAGLRLKLWRNALAGADYDVADSEVAALAGAHELSGGGIVDVLRQAAIGAGGKGASLSIADIRAGIEGREGRKPASR